MNVAIYNNKGGVGKTTLSTSIAFRANEKNIPCTFIDLDQQRNGLKWLSQDDWNGEESLTRENILLAKDMEYSGENGDLTIIDCPPAYEFLYDNILKHKIDLWIVPFKGRFSLDGAMSVLEQLKGTERNERVVFVNNMSDPSEKIRRKQIEEAKSLGVEMYKYSITRHKNFEIAEDMLVPVWGFPYSVRSGAVQSLQIFTDWVLNGAIPSKEFRNVTKKRMVQYEV